MNNRNKNNRIVFLTTLSVYLGLVLVGAPASQILAQAALTNRFEVKDKVEKRDDLGNKPSDEKSLTDYAPTLKELFILAENYRAGKQKRLNGRYEFDCFVNVGINADGGGHTVRCSGGSGMFWSGFISPLVKLNKTFAHTKVKEKHQVKINLVLSDEEFLLKTVLNQDSFEQAEQFYNFYDANLSIIKLQQLDNFQADLYENTKFTFKNDQVFIVTRLPRGSLDALLKQNAKADGK